MNRSLDSNVIVAGLIEAHAHPKACFPWIQLGNHQVINPLKRNAPRAQEGAG